MLRIGRGKSIDKYIMEKYHISSIFYEKEGISDDQIG